MPSSKLNIYFFRVFETCSKQNIHLDLISMPVLLLENNFEFSLNKKQKKQIYNPFGSEENFANYIHFNLYVVNNNFF